MELLGIKMGTSVLVASTSEVTATYVSNKSVISSFLFDGKKPQPTFHKLWFALDGMPETCQLVIPESRDYHGWRLREGYVPTDILPMESDSPDDNVSALYYRVYDVVPEQYVNEQLSISVIAEVDSVDDLRGYSFSITKNNDYGERNIKKTITDNTAIHQVIDRVLFPDILLATRPCKLTSEESYAIIRHHIRENIDGHHARMNDYDFCLTVTKNIRLDSPEPYTTEVIVGKKSRKQTQYRTHRDIEVCRMAPIRNRDGLYKGYPACPIFQGDNYRDLEQKIESYLHDLMVDINEPLEDCPHCHGFGVLRA